MELKSFTGLGQVLGVSRQQVWTWYRRREINDFPEPIMHLEKKGRVWDVEQVVAWRKTYVPTRSHRRPPELPAPQGPSKQLGAPDGEL